MTQARNYEPKGSLTPEEKLEVAFFYLQRGVSMHTLASMYDVNAGRIAEAVNAVRAALKFEGKEAEED